MKISKIKVSKEITYGILLFLFFAAVFSFGRHYLYSFNSWCFAVTGEVQQMNFANDGESPNYQPPPVAGGKDQPKASDKKSAAKTNTAVAVQKPAETDKPVRSNLPQTPQPKISILPSVENVDESKLAAFPDLRNYSGVEWKTEKTVVKMATDGNSLYATFLCYDADPANLVTKYSEAEGTASAWKDDSIEFFIMNSKDADHYYQLVSSASGLSHVFYLKTNNENGPTSFTPDAEFPKDFKKPFMRSEKCPEGFKITMEIDLKSFGFGRLDNGKELLLQVVRNYRDSADSKCAELQLFPTFIYADNRHGSQNHDRRAFMPAKAVKQ